MCIVRVVPLVLFQGGGSVSETEQGVAEFHMEGYTSAHLFHEKATDKKRGRLMTAAV
jgi:hypothetical protein